MDGLVLYATGHDGLWLVDSIHPGRDGSALILLHGWHDYVGEPDYRFPAAGVAGTKYGIQLTDTTHYRLEPLEEVADDFLLDHYDRQLLMWDGRRGDYLQALVAQSRIDRKFVFRPWFNAVRRRPSINIEERRKEYLAGERETGTIVVTDVFGRVVDALAIDAHKQAATARTGSRLRPYADLWRQTTDVVSVGEFLDWLSDQTPRGGVNWGTPRVNVVKGTVESLAENEQRRYAVTQSNV